ncbi:putative glycerophosphodiester phosphodiesterase [Helianthus anomalus]
MKDDWKMKVGEGGVIIEKRVTDMNLDEFLSYGPQREPNKVMNVGKPLFRKTKDGRIFEWKVEKDDYLCTLEEVFTKINHSKGFNIEFKFDDNILYTEEELVHVIQIVLRIVFKYAKNRSVIFSSFQPDAALLTRKLQSIYPVFFLTNGGVETYTDVRRNSLDEAMKLCLAGGLNGMVCEVRSILRNPGVIKRIKDLKLSLISYGQLNNIGEVVNAQILMGVDGVIVDLVQEITEVVANFGKEVENEIIVDEENDDGIKCSEKQLSSLMKVIEMKYICKILRVFYLCSGLKINLNKPNLYGIGVSNLEVKDKAIMVGCLAGETPFKYLALMVGANMNLTNNWKPMFDVFETRLSAWKANTLSIEGRAVLVKSVLESLPSYYFSLYRAPSKVIKDLEKSIRRFLWGGNSETYKMHWVSRDRVTIPKEDGGIGICKLKRINTTLLTKWVWRFKSEIDQLWRKVVEAIHTSRRN